MLRKGVFILFLAVQFQPISSERELIVDPLLEKPWIQDAREEESRSYFRFLSASKEVGKIKLDQDAFGRNFHIYPSMKIQYTIDNDYRREFPLLGDADLALSEMLALIRVNRTMDALFLGKGIGLCQRLYERVQKNFSPPWAKSANQVSNQLRSKYDDKPHEMTQATDPYGCYEGTREKLGNLYLESEVFRYQIQIPPNLRYEGLFRKEAGKYKKIDRTTMRLVRFVEFLAPIRNEGWDDMEEAMALQETGLISKVSRKILLSIGTTFDETPNLFTTKNYYKFWDKERALNSKIILERNFVRTEEGNDYISRFKVVDETGIISYSIMREYYYYKSPIGLFLSLSYPEQEKEIGESYWKVIRSDVQIKGYKK